MERTHINFSGWIGNYDYQFTFSNNFGHTKAWTACRHNHTEIEVQFILSGRCGLLIGDTRTEIKAGEVLMIAPQVYHAPISPFPGEDFEKYSFLFSYKKRLKDTDPFNAKDAEELAAAFRSIGHFSIFKDSFGGAVEVGGVIAELKKMQTGYRTRILSVMTGLVVLLARCVEDKKTLSEPLSEKTLDENRAAIMESFFDYDYRFKRTQEDLANSLGVSRRHLSRILQVTYRQSFREKLQQSRMEVAADLLVNTDRRIGSIADQLGYNTEAGFYRLFHHYYKSTPSDFRKKMRMR